MKKMITACLILLLLLPSCVTRDHKVYVKGEEIEGLFAYDISEIYNLLSNLKLEKIFKHEPHRNTDGSEIIFIPRGPTESNMLVLRQDGSYGYKQLPSYPSPNKFKNISSFANDLHISFFLFKQNRFKYSNPLYRLKIENFVGIGVFFNTEEIYAFGYNPRMNSSNNRYSEVYCYILHQKKGEITIKDRVTIKRPSTGESPFYVADMNIKTKDVLLVDTYDPPSISKWYLYNIGNRELKKIGNQHGYGLFLDNDIINNVLKQLKRK